MRNLFTIIGSIFAVISASLYYFKHSDLALAGVAITVLLYVVSILLNIKKDKAEENSANRKKPKIINAVVTDPQSDLVIKSISDEKSGFKTTQDIIRETNLPLKVVNKTIDFLLMNNFATEEKGRNGKIFILTPEGRTTFSQLVEK
jgi:predicted transcriptional regulator